MVSAEKGIKSILLLKTLPIFKDFYHFQEGKSCSRLQEVIFIAKCFFKVQKRDRLVYGVIFWVLFFQRSIILPFLHAMKMEIAQGPILVLIVGKDRRKT